VRLRARRTGFGILNALSIDRAPSPGETNDGKVP
jgi:hypothetical protein